MKDNAMRVGNLCKYTRPIDAEEAACLFVVVETAPDAVPPRVRIRPLFWPWPIVPEETVSPDDVTAVPVAGTR